MLKVDRPKKNSFRPNFYSKDEVQQLLEVSQDDPLHLCILITAYYGLRRSEVLGLKWSSIDFERKSITHQSQGNGTVGERQVRSCGQRCDEEQDQLPHPAADPGCGRRTSEAEGKTAALPQAVQEELQH